MAAEAWLTGDCLSLMKTQLEKGQVDLVVTSPPYNVGKEYEKASTEEEYIAFTARAAKALWRVLRPGGSLCWQVGISTGMSKGEELPIDVLAVPLFRKQGFQLKNRVVWRVPHGLNPTGRLSGRHETLLWFVKPGADYTFNLDEIRIPAVYPGKKRPGAETSKGNALGRILATCGRSCSPSGTRGLRISVM